MARQQLCPDWQRKVMREAYYASIPYGLRQQLGIDTSSEDEEAPANTQQEEPKLAQVPSLMLVSPLSTH